jgi:mevalonate kinase
LYSASAPGSLMLMGEHAVLHGAKALVMAIDKRIKVTLKPCVEKNTIPIKIHSALGTYQSELGAIEIQKPFQFVLAAIMTQKKHISSGFELFIESECSDQMGFGSSAAVTVATLAVLSRAFDFEIDIFESAKQVVRRVQGGVGSGADVAASVEGGVVYYGMEPRSIETIRVELPIALMYTGSKKPTAEVIAWVDKQRKDNPSIFETFFKSIAACTEEAYVYLKNQDWPMLGKIMDFQQGIMSTMNLSNSAIDNAIAALKAEPGIYGAKISGSGLGDCVIGLGTISHPAISCALSPVGLRYES